MRRRAGIVILVAVSLGPANAADIPAPIRDPGSGGFLEPACSDTELVRLLAETRAAAQDRRPDEAWSLVRNLLCGSGAQAGALLTKHTADKIRVEALETGDESDAIPNYEPRGSVVPLASAAWDARVEASDEDVRLSYRADAACIASFTMRYRSGDWQIFGVARACE